MPDKKVSLSPAQIRMLRMRAQRLQHRSTAGVAQLLKDVCGVQAQEPRSALLAVWARSGGLSAQEVEEARVRAGSITRTWCMRGTLHLLATEDLGWLLPLHGPLFIKRSRRRYAELGLDEDIIVRAMGAIRIILHDQGPLTRAELAEELAQEGIPTEGQAAYHLVRRAGLEGNLCFGPDRDGQPTYVLLEDSTLADSKLQSEAALAQLARRYLEAYGPAGVKDLSTWSGIGMIDARRGFKAISDELIELEFGDSQVWMLESQAAWLDERYDGEVVVRLLPSFDPYLLGYRSRELTVPQENARRIHPGGGVIRPVLLVDGVAAGAWKLKRIRDGYAVQLESFEKFGVDISHALKDEVKDLGRFLGVEVKLIG